MCVSAAQRCARGYYSLNSKLCIKHNVLIVNHPRSLPKCHVLAYGALWPQYWQHTSLARFPKSSWSAAARFEQRWPVLDSQ